jgi:hypothetical protein
MREILWIKRKHDYCSQLARLLENFPRQLMMFADICFQDTRYDAELGYVVQMFMWHKHYVNTSSPTCSASNVGVL